MNSVVYVPRIKQETVMALSAFCEKASMVSTGWDVKFVSLGIFIVFFMIVLVLLYKLTIPRLQSFFGIKRRAIKIHALWKLFSGLSGCTNSVYRIYLTPASCNSSILSLQKRGDSWIKVKSRGKSIKMTTFPRLRLLISTEDLHITSYTNFSTQK